MLGMGRAITEEAIAADRVKRDLPIMVVMGNPPYSGVSSNETAYANSLINKYKIEPGGKQKLQERKHWLNDDYVKFIAYAESMIERNGSGIVAMITNNGYLDNPTFRGMRWHLANTFDSIYLLDLHGNAKKKEVSPNGGKDENVFDIMQGVGIMIAVKNGKNKDNLANIFHADIYGKRQTKYEKLESKVDFVKIESAAPSHYFVPKNTAGQEDYQRGVPLNQLMPINSTGIVSMGDSFIISENRDDIAQRVQKLSNNEYTEDELKEDFNLGKNYAKYVLSSTVQFNYDESLIVPIAYRPFDTRFTYFDNKVLWRWREKVMRNMLDTHTHTHQLNNRGNILMIFRRQQPQGIPFSSVFTSEFMISDGVIRSDPHGGETAAPLYVDDSKYNASILATRQQKTGNGFHHVFTTDKISESSLISNKTGEISSQFPLYITQPSHGRRANFNDEMIEILFSDVEQLDEIPKKITPEDIMDYIYGSLYSPSYREKYKEFLKTDFPRVPRPKTWDNFWRKVRYGSQLRELHLMHSIEPFNAPLSGEGNDLIENIAYSNNRIYINKSQYFPNIPEIAWTLYIGGYQPAQKWLKDRKGRELLYKDVEHYQRIIRILLETDRIMREIG